MPNGSCSCTYSACYEDDYGEKIEDLDSSLQAALNEGSAVCAIRVVKNTLLSTVL